MSAVKETSWKGEYRDGQSRRCAKQELARNLHLAESRRGEIRLPQSSPEPGSRPKSPERTQRGQRWQVDTVARLDASEHHQSVSWTRNLCESRVLSARCHQKRQARAL